MYIFIDEVPLELQAPLAHLSVRDGKHDVLRLYGLHQPLQLAVVRVTRVRHLEVEGQVPVVFVIPPREDDEDCRLLLVAGLDTIARGGG